MFSSSFRKVKRVFGIAFTFEYQRDVSCKYLYSSALVYMHGAAHHKALLCFIKELWWMYMCILLEMKYTS